MFYPKSPFLKDQLVESQLFSRNPPNLSDLLKWLCQPPTVTTYRVNCLKSSVEEFKKVVNSAVLKKYNVTPNIFTVEEIPEVLCIPPLDNAQIHPLKEAKEVVVDVSCGAAVLRGAHIFAPGVISMESGTKYDGSVNVYVDVEGKCKKGYNKILMSDQKTFIGIGKAKMQRHQLYGENLRNNGIAIEMDSTISGVPCIGDLSSEVALLQNFPSIVCVRVLDPQINDIVLDMCSAPGNKTTHIAELMGDQGIVIALDKTDRKIDLVRAKIELYKLKSVRAFAFDSTKVFNETSQLQLEAPPFAAETFDRILLDAPCSALGNRPLLSSNLSTKMLKSFPKVQKKLLRNAVKLLKPNGVLVYSTCSIAEEENELMAEWVLEEFPQMKLAKADPIFGGPAIENSCFTDDQGQFFQRFGPDKFNRGCSVNSIGFFIAKFVKSS